jgi:GAF domain-containing protein
MEREKKYLPLLLEVTKAITSTRDAKEVFDLIVRKVPEVMDVDAATIRLLDESGKKLHLRAAFGLSDAYLNRGPVDAEESVMKALAGTPIAVPEAAEDSRFHYPEEARTEGIHSILVAPIPIRGEVRGILRLLTKTRRIFEPVEIDLAASLAEQCGIAIENAGSYETLNRQLEYFKALYRIGKEINATRELDRILDLITARLPEVMDLKACTIRLIEETKGRFELKSAYGLSRSYLERGPLDEELATYYILEGDPVVIPDARVDIHTIYKKEAAEEGIGSILAVPIAVEDETIGMLRLLTGEVRFFSDADINFALAVAQQSGIAIRNAIDYRKLRDALPDEV